MRRCKATAWAEGEKVSVEGLFHRWSAQCVEAEDGVGNYTVALIELDDGRIVEANPDKVVFLDTATKKVGHDELAKAAVPLLELLNKYYDPHAYAIVTEGRVEVVRGEISALLPIRD